MPFVRSLKSIRPLLLTATLVLLGGVAASTQTPAPGAAPARHPEEGQPFVRTYAPLDVNAAGQNWALVQDERGVIYVGSQSGVVEFDGVNWRLIETETLSTVRSLAIDRDGRISDVVSLD